MSENIQFQAEVSKLLDIVVNSLYSEKHIFLRELISNASDACDKFKYLTLTRQEISKNHSGLKIKLIPNPKENTLIISDTGIGMNKDDLINHLGTIAKSGTSDFIKNIKDNKSADFNLIGQFGVGFYSAFMVADKIELTTKRADEETAWKWCSDGKGSFTIEPTTKIDRGTDIKLFLKEDQKEFADAIRLRFVVRTYSDHVNYPIILKQEDIEETINTASAIWTRNKAEITTEQYKEFYHHVSHQFDEPWMTLHYHAEGVIDYKTLLFIPTQAPHDLFQPDRNHNLKLYVNKVFISDKIEGLIPSWLRFIKGVVDSADLKLNISREMLQHNVLISKIKTGIVNRILKELKSKMKDYDEYEKFWNSFGGAFKEGLYEDITRRDEIMSLCMFKTTHGDKLTTLEDYISRMKDGQESIYFINGDDANILKNNPQIEAFKSKGLEVLLLTDPIDEFWPQVLTIYKDKKIKHVSTVDEEISKIENIVKREGKKADEGSITKLCEKLKTLFADELAEVKTTERLTNSPSCLTVEQGQMSIHLERLMRQHQQQSAFASKRILELNPYHPLIIKLSDLIIEDENNKNIENACYLLLDQAKINEGEPIKDPSGFAKRLSDFIITNL